MSYTFRVYWFEVTNSEGIYPYMCNVMGLKVMTNEINNNTCSMIH